jgi:multiple antibiotic resistance protein
MQILGNVEILKTFVGMISLMNPIAAIPIFLSLCSGKPAGMCNRLPKITTLALIIILSVSIWFGDLVLKMFGISISAFQTGGGILILLMAIDMLNAKQTHVKHTPSENKEMESRDHSDLTSIAIVPLAMPLMAGPGAISFTIIQSNQLDNFWEGRIMLTLIAVAAVLIAWLTLISAQPIGKKLGTTGLNIITRLMGMVLAAIGIQMITQGLLQLLPGLSG